MKRLTALRYFLVGLYLRFSGGETPKWLPLSGEHHLFEGIVFHFGEVCFTDAVTGENRSVALVDDFGELGMLAGNGEIVRLNSMGRRSAVLIHPDGQTIERLRCNHYSTQIRRHGLIRYFIRGVVGGSDVVVLSGGTICLDETTYSLTSTDNWRHRLKDGSFLDYRKHCQLLHRERQQYKTFLWSASEDRLLSVDYHREELRFAWATSESLSPTSILDGILTVHPEEGSVQILHYTTKSRGEAIDFYGPGGLRICREEGSDVLWAWQGETLIGVAQYIPNGGTDKKGDSYHRWAFSAGGYAELPLGSEWICPMTTAVVAAIPLVACTALLVSESLAQMIAMPLLTALGLVVGYRQLKPLVLHILS